MGLHRTESFHGERGLLVAGTIRSQRLFKGEARELVVGLKYSRVKGCAGIMSQMMWSDYPDIGAADVLTWIPTLRQRREQRGFDHAELLARHISVLSGVRAYGLLRRTSSGYQTGKSRQERHRGVCFVGHPRCAGRIVYVFDDVCTTGATFRAASQALANAGASEIRCISFVYVS